jgi:nucleotide-binding universal stress UspA family protein
VKVIAVHVPLPIVAPDVQFATPTQGDAQARTALARDVRGQLDRLAIDGMWPLEVITGDPAATLANVARNIGASLIIMGLGGHGVLDRILGDEPVLAVAPGYSGLPSRVLAAVDFSASGVRALTLGTEIMQRDSNLTLAHVISPDLDPVNWNGKTTGYHATVGRALDRVIAEMGFGEVASVERRVLAGDPARELIHLAEELKPDLILAGSHGHNFFTRLLLGSVSTRLIRSGRCSVLVAPPKEGVSFMDELPKVTTQFSSYEWAERLEEFSRRNIGRVATLEVIDPEIGAQVEERKVPFAGASFDPRDARVHLMFGDAANGRHLTRSVGGVTAIQTLRDRSGKDLFLRVAHGRGQTLLTLER